MSGSGTCRTLLPSEVGPWWPEVGVAVPCAGTPWTVVSDAAPCSRTPWPADNNVSSGGRTSCSPAAGSGVVSAPSLCVKTSSWVFPVTCGIPDGAVVAAVLLVVPGDPTTMLLMSSPSTVPGSAPLLEAPLEVAGGGASRVEQARPGEDSFWAPSSSWPRAGRVWRGGDSLLVHPRGAGRERRDGDLLLMSSLMQCSPVVERGRRGGDPLWTPSSSFRRSARVAWRSPAPGTIVVVAVSASFPWSSRSVATAMS